MPYKDKEKQKEFQRKWARNKGPNSWLSKKIELLHAAKDIPCQSCGEIHPPCCMDLHHVDPTDKKYEISFLKKNGSIQLLEEELKKCVCLCALCHRKLHAGLLELNPL